jgi:hypothetical protein
MSGTITYYTGTTIRISVDYFIGTATQYNSWRITVSGPVGPAGPAAAFRSEMIKIRLLNRNDTTGYSITDEPANHQIDFVPSQAANRYIQTCTTVDSGILLTLGSTRSWYGTTSTTQVFWTGQLMKIIESAAPTSTMKVAMYGIPAIGSSITDGVSMEASVTPQEATFLHQRQSVNVGYATSDSIFFSSSGSPHYAFIFVFTFYN